MNIRRRELRCTLRLHRWRRPIGRATPVGLMLSLTVLISAWGAEAQPPGKVWRIGYLGNVAPPPSDPVVDAFRAGMREHGYVEGQNVIIERRFAEGREDRFTTLVAELIALKVDLMLVVSTQAA